MPGRLASRVNNFVRMDRFERVGPKVFDIFTAPRSANRYDKAPEGAVVSIVGRAPGAQLFASSGNRNIRYEDITVHTSPELVFVFVDTEGITVEGCQILIPDGRWKTTNGDAFHAQNCRGPARMDRGPTRRRVACNPMPETQARQRE